MEFLETEITALDAMLGGGIPIGTTLLIYGPQGTGKSILSTQIAFKTVLNGKKAIIVNFENNAIETVKKMNKFGWDFKKHPRNIYFVDCSGTEKIKNNQIHVVNNPSDPNEIFEKINTIFEKENSWIGIILIDDLSSLMINSSPKETYKFMRAIQHKINKSQGIVLAVLQKGIFDEKNEKLIEHATDGTLLTFDESPRKISVKRMIYTKINKSKLSYIINDKGIKFNLG